MIGPALLPATGTSILFKILLDQMRSRGVTVDLVQIPRGGKHVLTKPLKFLRVLAQMIRVVPLVDVVSAHVPTPQLSNVAFAALVMAKIFRRPFVVRKFGGMDPWNLRLHARFLAKQTLRQSDAALIEARRQCTDLAERLSRQIFWYPNCRPKPAQQSPPRWQGGRFVYLGRVCREKGIEEIIEAAADLGPDACVDIYGPCEEDGMQAKLDGAEGVRYRGVVEHRNMLAVLSEYDALLLPTYWEGEGYPGVIVEALQIGLPVIATRWKFIPEMLDDTCGILVKPGDARELSWAMRRFINDEALAHRLRFGALSRAEMFCADKWGAMFLEVCRTVYNHRGHTAMTAQHMGRLQVARQ